MCVFEPAARHTAATLMLDLDISPGWLPARLGQAAVAKPLDRSSHISDSLRGEATRTVRGLLEGRRATDTGQIGCQNRLLTPTRTPIGSQKTPLGPAVVGKGGFDHSRTADGCSVRFVLERGVAWGSVVRPGKWVCAEKVVS